MITGNTGANILDGGIGADTMTGLKGNDIYNVDNAGDAIVEAANAGTDTVNASVSYTLGSNLENLTLTGSDPVNGTGNALVNVMIGNDGNNVLMGLAGNDKLFGGIGADTLNGGIGNDQMTGGADNDTFHFDQHDKADVITDFVSGTDKIEIAAAGFTGAVPGNVHLVSNAMPKPADGSATFLFDTDNGRLYWDDDGTGAHAAQQFVTLTGVHALAATDLMIV